MKHLKIITTSIIFVFAFFFIKSVFPFNSGFVFPTGITQPKAEKKYFEMIAHGDKRIDEYYWLNDFFKKGPDSSKVVEYLKAENAYLDTMLSQTKELQNNLFTEMRSRIKEVDESVPVFKNGYFYYTRTEEGKEYFKYCRKINNLNSPEEILLDVDLMAEGFKYFSARGFSVSPNNKILAFGVDNVSRRQYKIKFKNLETGQILNDEIPNTSGSSIWANDNETIFYTENDPLTLLSVKIRKHKLGTNSKYDPIVYHEFDPSNYIGVTKTLSNKFILIYSSATLSSEIRILDADNPNGKFKIFQPRMKDVLYSVDHWEDKFLIVTNWNAKNFKLMETPINNTKNIFWSDVIPHRDDVLLEGIDIFQNFWAITERKNGLLQIRIKNISSQKEHYLDFGEPTYMAYVGDNKEYSTSLLRFNYTSLTTPNSVFDYNMETKEKILKKEKSVLGDFNKSDYFSERIFALSRDSVKIPISLVYKKSTKINGSAPLLLYGYGSYGASMDATFNSDNLSLLDRGFIFAIAHVRGGQELGRSWYDDGKMLNKKNTFFDFIDCGNFLINKNYTSLGHLYAMGGSAGGLLMGAITNYAPELWNGVIAEVPFVDVVTTMSDPTIPLTTNEYDEWGNPSIKENYFNMKSYSPYDNVERKDYPNLLVTTGLFDSQVQYFEPAKWVARLRDLKTDNNLLLLKTNMDAGHGGASGRFDYLHEVALQFAFLFALEGITE